MRACVCVCVCARLWGWGDTACMERRLQGREEERGEEPVCSGVLAVTVQKSGAGTVVMVGRAGGETRGSIFFSQSLSIYRSDFRFIFPSILCYSELNPPQKHRNLIIPNVNRCSCQRVSRRSC